MRLTTKKIFILFSILSISFIHQLHAAPYSLTEDDNDGYGISPFILSPQDTTAIIEESKKPAPHAIFKGDISRKQEELLKQIKRPFEEGPGINVTGMYTALGQAATEGHPYDSAAGASVDVYATKRLFQKFANSSDITTLGLHVSERHKYTPISPQALGAMFQSLLPTTAEFDTMRTQIHELWLQERVLNDRAFIRAGRIDLKAVYNDYSFDSSKIMFVGAPFTGTPGTPTLYQPFGLMALMKLYHGIFGGFTVQKASSLFAENPPHSFEVEWLRETKSNKTPLFESFEFGYRTLFHHTFNTIYRVLLWNVEPSAERNRFANSKGISLFMQQYIKGDIIPFFRYDMNNGRYIDFKQAIIVGAGIFHPFQQESGLLGVGLSFQEPSNKAIKPEYTFEGYYRIQATPFIQITPDLQLISNRKFFKQKDGDLESSPHRDLVSVFSLRFRLLE